MSQKFISKTTNAILEESSENDSEQAEEINESENSIILNNKENANLLTSSLDLIEKKKRESFVNNLRLSLKDPMLDISNLKGGMPETRTKIEMLILNRKEIENQIEQKLVLIEKYETDIFKMIEDLEKSEGFMETSIKMSTDKKNESPSEILKKRREEYQKKKQDAEKEAADKSKLDQLKKKFNKNETSPTKNDLPLKASHETKPESSNMKFDDLQKELDKKLSFLNKQKEEAKTLKEPGENSNKISLNDYKAQLKQKFHGVAISDSNIPLESSPSKTEPAKIRKINSKIADRVANLEKLFAGGPPNPILNYTSKDPLERSQTHKEDVPGSVILDHLTFDRADMPQKKNKKSKTMIFLKRVSKEW